MAEIRYGQPGLYATAKLGREAKNERLYVFDSRDDATRDALQYANRENHFVIYELREVARVVVDEPRIELVDHSARGES